MGISVFRDRVAGRELVGRIERKQGARIEFSYDAGYVSRSKANGELGISERLPLTTVPYANKDAAPFFQGLLPEGAILGNLATVFQVARNDCFGLLERLGHESIGALTFLSDDYDVTPNERDPGGCYEPMTREVLATAMRDPVYLATGAAIETRLSLSGAQSKVAWFLPEGKRPEESEIEDWLIPSGTMPSSHIIKMSRRGEEELALNETACSLLSEACGFETAHVSLVPDLPGAVAIERYDRQWVDAGSGRKLLRLHQEDFCQALGLSPTFKYQPEGVDADYIMYSTDLLRDTVANPASASREFAKRLVFDYAVGNTDAHLKNSSLLYDGTWKRRGLAPAYDITCIPLSGYSTKMPFDIGQHRRLDEIDARDILAVALDAGVGLSEFCADVAGLVASLESSAVVGIGSDTASMVERILDDARPRLKVLRAFLEG